MVAYQKKLLPLFRLILIVICMKNTTLELQLIQYTSYDEKLSRTNALYSFCELMKCQIHRIDDGYDDRFVVQMPENDFQFCHVVNAFHAFCYLYSIASALSVPSELE
ncbi:MAG: hypothetical protein CSA89_01465 [Bacteroidales bacterium]|nr:MAG: hypothetical protein CSA89_01465 [Bacteroidales bacterium]